MRIASAQSFLFVPFLASFVAEYSAKESKVSLCKFPESFSLLFSLQMPTTSASLNSSIFSSQFSETTVFWLGLFPVVQSRNASRLKTKENVGFASLNCLSHSDHFPTFTDVQCLQKFHLFLLVFLLLMVKSHPSYSNMCRSKCSEYVPF